MDSKTLFEKLEQLRVVPIVKISDAADAPALADAVMAGGLPCIEITFRTTAARNAIGAIASRGDMLVGAGTVLSVDTAQQAVDAGAVFIVTPGFNPRVVEYCLQSGVPVAPGVCTPTDIETALGCGLEVLKFFPAEAMGGLATLKAVSAPFGMVRFIPTGGINEKNMGDYLAFPKTLCCGGSWMVKPELITGKDFGRITALVRGAVEAARAVERKNNPERKGISP